MMLTSGIWNATPVSNFLDSCKVPPPQFPGCAPLDFEGQNATDYGASGITPASTTTTRRPSFSVPHIIPCSLRQCPWTLDTRPPPGSRSQPYQDLASSHDIRNTAILQLDANAAGFKFQPLFSSSVILPLLRSSLTLPPHPSSISLRFNHGPGLRPHCCSYFCCFLWLRESVSPAQSRTFRSQYRKTDDAYIAYWH